MNGKVCLAAAYLLFALPACQNENSAEPTSTAPGSLGLDASAPTASTLSSAGHEPSAATPPTPPQYEMPVPVDFQEEAERTITKANYKAELSALEAEIK
jgi:hypothetical protein